MLTRHWVYIHKVFTRYVALTRGDNRCYGTDHCADPIFSTYVHSSPFSPQGSRFGSSLWLFAWGSLSRSAWEPPFTMRKEGLRSIRVTRRGARVFRGRTFHTNTGSNGDLAFFSREYCLECESLEPASLSRAIWIAWNRPRAETKEGRRGRAP